MAKRERIPDEEELAIVTLGSMNPAIFQPEWFIRNGMISEDTRTEIKVISHDVTEIQLGNVRLVSIGERIVLSTTNVAYAEAMLDFAQGIFSKLSHTPLTACGINHGTLYSVDSVEYWHLIGDTLAPKEIWRTVGDDPGMQTLEIKIPVKGTFPGYRVFTIQPAPATHPKHPAIRFRVNNHFSIDQIPKENQTTPSAPLVQRFLTERWGDATQSARQIADKIFESIPRPK